MGVRMSLVAAIILLKLVETMANRFDRQAAKTNNQIIRLIGVGENKMATQKQTTKTVKYDVWSLDVWRNETDGFDVNDRSCFQRDVEFPTTHKTYNEGTPQEFSDNWPTDQQIIDKLIEIGYFKGSVKLADVDIDGDPNYSLYIDDSKNGRPLCQIENSDN